MTIVGNKIASVFLWLFMTLLFLVACAASPAEPAPAAPPAAQEQAPLPQNDGPADVDLPPPTLPPPLILTIPADRLDITIDDAGVAAGAITTQGEASGELLQFEEGLPAEVNALLERIYNGEYPIDTTGQNPGALPATFTYSDMNGDGVEDLVIILVVGPGDYSNVTAGVSSGNPVIQIIPRPEAGTVVEELNIPMDELLAMTGNGEGENIGEGAYLITLGPDDLSRWSDPVLAE